MKNQDVAHQFFYDRNGSFNRSNMTVSYYNNKFFSYGTCIGEISTDINGNEICIISDDNFSSTTSKHLGELRYACPMNIAYLPQNMGNSEFWASDIVKELKRTLEYYAKSKLTQKPNRQALTHNFEMLEDCLRLQKFEKYTDEINNTLNQYKDLVASINDPEKLKQYKEKQAKIEREKQAKLKKELNTLLDTHSYIDLVRFAFSEYSFVDVTADNYNEIKEQKAKLRKYFNPKNELSFAWVDGDYMRTSQHVSVDKKEATILLKLWLNDKLKHGMMLSHYMVRQVMHDYVQIGCHRLPVENLRAIAHSLNLIGV